MAPTMGWVGGQEGFEILVTSRNFCKPDASGIRAYNLNNINIEPIAI